jgi:ribulose-5-phosphate 4-epimerase/fuculose-1-phosphate aldolase
MQFASTSELRAEVLVACRVLTYFAIVEGFGHVSARVPDQGRILITPRRALGLVSESELVELDTDGGQVAGGGSPPLEAAMHLAVYRRRPDVTAIARGHPRHVAAFACAGAPLRIAHGFGTNLGALVPIFREPFLVEDAAIADRAADALGDAQAVILQSNGMLAVGQSITHACVRALFLEETAQAQLLAAAANMTPHCYTPEDAARRHGEDAVHEPLRAWEYYLGVADGRIAIGSGGRGPSGPCC